jgi:hypothetical protein
MIQDPGAAVGNGSNARGVGVDGAIPKKLLDYLEEGVIEPLGGEEGLGPVTGDAHCYKIGEVDPAVNGEVGVVSPRSNALLDVGVKLVPKDIVFSGRPRCWLGRRHDDLKSSQTDESLEHALLGWCELRL